MKKNIIAILLLLTCIINAQSKLTGVLAFDYMVKTGEPIKDDSKKLTVTEGRKKPIIAAGLSAAIPGAGQFYSESYIKAALFLAVETAAITVGLMYDKKGDDQTTFFQTFANAHWSVEKYARWTVKNAKTVNSSVDPSQYAVFNSQGKVNWSELNRLEAAIGNYYSHRLPRYGEQQYFELIGKYAQYNVGWDDFGDENAPFAYGDPLTSRFLYYADERGKANDFYNIASKAVIVVFVNHLISAVDAALSANSYNKDLELNTSIEKFNYGYATYYIPQLNLRYRF